MMKEMIALDAEEKEILEAFESGQLKSIPDKDKESFETQVDSH